LIHNLEHICAQAVKILTEHLYAERRGTPSETDRDVMESEPRPLCPISEATRSTSKFIFRALTDVASPAR
jgi:hypothetical protein